MSRHRDMHHMNKNVDEERDDDYGDSDYGHSVDDDSCLSRSMESEFLIRRNNSSSGNMRHNFSVSDFIKEQPEPEEETDAFANAGRNRDIQFTIDDEPAPSVPVRSSFLPRSNIVVSLGDNGPTNSNSFTNGVAFDAESPARQLSPDPPTQAVGRLSISDRIRNEEEQGRASSKSPSRQTPIRGLPPNNSSQRLAALAAATQIRKPRVRPTGGKTLISLVVIGHVDAGKSTLMGHLLYLIGSVNQRQMHKFRQESQKVGKSSFAYAWVLDESSEERERGVTMDIAKTQFETQNKQIVLLDAPGHKDFIPNMITGAAQADAALLVVNATRGEFETGFDLGGQTREHAMLVRSLGVSQLAVAINKLDTVDWSQQRYDEITTKLKQFLQKQAGFTAVKFVPVCGISGENLKDSPPDDHPLRKWYDGPTLFGLIDGFDAPLRNDEKPLRITVSDVFKGATSGITVAGRVETGSIEAGDKVIIMPNGDVAQVKTVQGDQVGLESNVCFAGDQCLLTLISSGLDNLVIGPGHVICHPDNPIMPSQRLRLRLMLFDVAVPITSGYTVTLHANSLCESGVITRLCSQLHKGTGQVIKKKPRCLSKNTHGVVDVNTEKPVCLEEYSQCRELGRVTLRSSGKTVATGLVEKVFIV